MTCDGGFELCIKIARIELHEDVASFDTVTVLDVELANNAAARVHTPAGLDIGARTPGEVALAILAEIVASRPRSPGQSRSARGKQSCVHRGTSGGE